MSVRLPIGMDVVVQFPATCNRECEQIGIHPDWYGKTWYGKVCRIDGRSKYANYCIKFDSSRDWEGWETWWCHNNWVKPKGGPW